MYIRAYAKINLSLIVLGKRKDGFHELETIMQSVSLFDELDVTTAERYISIEGDVPGFPRDRENIIYRAIAEWQKASGIRSGFKIRVKKRIPMAAGLGGGSSDAAAVLKAINQMFDNPLNTTQLTEIAGKIGSDVPFFLMGGTVFAWGRGEKTKKLPFLGRKPVLLVNPGFQVSTRSVYEKLNLGLTTSPSTPNILPAFSAGAVCWNTLADVVHNDLQSTVIDLHPEIGKIVGWMRERNALTAVSGSGGTVFGLFESPMKAKTVADDAAGAFPWSMLVETIDPDKSDH